MKQKTFNLLVLPSEKNVMQVTKKFPFPVELTKGSFDDLEFVFQDNHVAILHKGVDLKNFSFVWLSSFWNYRDLSYAIRLYLEQSKTPHTYVEKSTSKITDHMLFTINGIQTPNTLFICHKEVQKNLDQIEKTCGYPLIVKDIKGSKGAHSILVANAEELASEMKNLPKHKKYLFQKYISNQYDWGVMVANGVVVSGEKSYHCEGEFRNNVCNGAKEVFVDLNEIPMQIKEMALRSSDALGLAWSRADIIVDEDTQIPYLMEVNRRPLITSETSEVEGAYMFLSSEIERLVK